MPLAHTLRTRLERSSAVARPLIASLLLTLLLGSTATLRSQPLFPDYVEAGIDSALSSILMTRYDLTMRQDAAGEDIHRFEAIRRMFAEPLYSFTLSDSITRVALQSLDEPMLLFRSLRGMLDLNENFPDPARIVVKDREIGVFGRFDISTLDYTEALVLRRFVALAIATDVATLRNREHIDKATFERVVDFADSLLIQSEDAGETDLISMRYAERYGLERAKQFFNQEIAPFDYNLLLSPGVAMYAQALDYTLRMKGEIESYHGKVRTSIWESPLGLIAIGGAGDDVYTGDFFCIVDIGGNDVYRAAPRDKATAAKRSTTLIVDFDGDDTYIGEDFVFGGTLFGSSVVIDMKGDDSYKARNFSLGTGYFGVGILHDNEGQDQYRGGTAVQGAGVFGIGLIVDGDGNDTYAAHLAAQGFGYTRGFGMIADHRGNDQYLSSSPYQDYLRYDDHYESFCQGASLGYRPVASGGYGLIAEGGGSDLYFSDIFGQGTAYWYGLGGIVDYGGNDNYTSFQYAQGSGVHLAFGILSDYDGNDNYVSHGVSQGCGHDIAFGGLYDLKGEDNYVVESLSLGGGNANAISLFIDAGGEDGYIARHNNTLGYSDLRRNYGMIGIFLDLDGDDYYGTSRGGNDSLWLGSTYGVGIDAMMKPEEIKREEEKKEEKSEDEILAELETDFERLFIQASAAPQSYQYLVEPARKRLEEGADTTIPRLLAKLDSEHPRELLALRVILPRIGTRLTPLLIDTIHKGEKDRVGMAIHILGRLKDSTAAAPIGRKLRDENWRIRSTAAEALLNMNAEGARKYLSVTLDDSVDLVRARIARAFARIADSSELPRLFAMFDDPSQLVRYQIGLGFRDRDLINDSLYGDLLVDHLVDRNERTRYSYNILHPLAESAESSERRLRIFRGLASDRDPAVRADAVDLAIVWRDDAVLRLVNSMKRNEESSEVLYKIYQAEGVEADTGE